MNRHIGFTNNSPRWQRIAILIALATIVLIFNPAVGLGLTSHEIGIITASNLNMRPEPGTTSPPITVLKQGTEVKVLAHEAGWLKIEHNGQIGYIQNRERYVRIIASKPSDPENIGQEKFKNSARKIKRYREEAEAIEREIQNGKAALQTIGQKELGVLGSLNEIELSMDKASRRISISKSQVSELERKIANITERHKTLTKQIEANEDYAAKRLAALYKISWVGKMNLLVTAQSIQELLQRQRALEHILAYDEKVRQKLITDRARLKELLDDLNAQQLKKRTLQLKIKQQYTVMSRKRAQRLALLEEIRSQRSLQVAAIESLKKAAVALNKTLENIRDEDYPFEQFVNVNMQPFSEFKGLLKMPVRGKIISYFGPYRHPKFNVTNFRSGIDIEARRGEQVQAIFAGRILYADWFKGYGNMVIIDHGENYYTVYAHLETLLKQKGDRVNTGDEIGTVGDTGSLFGPNLYFEVRYRGKPMNPLDWIIKG
ncbi:MAG: peptidoglycan DD-metalloendopeptidase family protein [Desulfobacterales bacterium]